jgi:hypothetical protein
MYLSSLQNGIQTAHIVSELFAKYDSAESDNPQTEQQESMVYDWAHDHKTIINLDGGNSANLTSINDWLELNECPFPFTSFHEDEESLNGAITGVGIVLPEYVYEAMALYRKTGSFTESLDEVSGLTKFEQAFIELHCNYRLAS